MTAIVKDQSYPCRCRACGQRKRLRHAPAWYIRAPACACGARSWRIDVYRASGREQKKAGGTCRCDEYHFPHRRGSGYCKDNTSMTVEKYALRFGVVLT